MACSLRVVVKATRPARTLRGGVLSGTAWTLPYARRICNDFIAALIETSKFARLYKTAAYPICQAVPVILTT